MSEEPTGVTEKSGTVDALRAATPARLFLPRSGAALATQANLALRLAHAQARDAIHERLDFDALGEAARKRGVEALHLKSAAADRRRYLMRPDLGRRLDPASRALLSSHAGDYDIAFVIADGLSARAIASHAFAFLDAALVTLRDWKIAPVALVEQGRVAIGDEIGETLGARLVAVLIGERPGLSSPDSLGVYLTHAPRIGRTDAERNCLSNIRREGMSYEEAAQRLHRLCVEARRRGLTGVALKDESAAPDSASDGQVQGISKT